MISESLIPSKPRWKHVEEVANRLTEIYSMPPIPVREIAEENGVNVVFADFGKSADKVAGLCDFANSKLYANAEDILTRQIFTIAHELGHWLLHKEIFEKKPDLYPVLPRYQLPDQKNILEKEANHFAACLLVPRRLLLPVKEVPPATLAHIFAVSRTMMEHRLKNVS